MKCRTFIGALGLFAALMASAVRADIDQWEYINPADPSQGKLQSTALAPDGAGVDAVPSADLGGRNLTMAYLIGADLTGAFGFDADLTNADLSHANVTNATFAAAILSGANFHKANLTNAYLDSATLSGADLSEANLTNANFIGSTLTDADFTSARVEGANFDSYSAPFCYPCGGRFGTGIALAELYSTASYHASDLRGIGLGDNDLTYGNFVDQNLTDASFYRATLTNADFTGADVRGANFGISVCLGSFLYCDYPSGGTGITPAQLSSTASHQAQDLSGVGFKDNSLAGADFAGQNLANADFFGATLTDADFAGAEIRGANFARYYVERAVFAPSGPFGTGITLAQLYSTASYQAGDLSGINFEHNEFDGGNFAGQRLTNVGFYGATLAGADFTGADARGAQEFYRYSSSGVITANVILPNGHISGLDLDVGRLFVRDYDGNIGYFSAVPPIRITIDQHLVMGPGGTLRLVFEADAWDSAIAFGPDIPVILGGTLELTFATDVNLASQVGRTLKLFDWTGVNPIGIFTVSSPYAWDLSHLYTTGDVTLKAVPEPNALLLLSFALAAILVTRGTSQLRSARVSQAAGSIITILVCTTGTWADIFQWEYINPVDPSQVKQQSTTLAPDGAGVDAVPGADVAGRDLTKAYLIGADFTPFTYYIPGCLLCGARQRISNLSGANLADADLTSADFGGAILTGANFAGADIRGASFQQVRTVSGALFGGISLTQLYSTTSYQARDLSGIDLGAQFNFDSRPSPHYSGAEFGNQNLRDARFSWTDLTGANFRQANLTNADFSLATLTGIDFTDAEVRGANFGKSRDGTGITLEQLYSTASYRAHDLSRIWFVGNDLNGANLAGQNLTNVTFTDATLTGADFHGAIVREANFSRGGYPFGTGISLEQLYSTASYQVHDLTGINLATNDLAGANFAGQNLTNANFGILLTGADFTGAEVRGASFGGITLTQLYSTASYQAHDLRGIGLPGNFVGGNFVGQNLTNAAIGGTLTGADFTGAEVRGVSFGGITLTQLYSTASYLAHDLTGIEISNPDLNGANFAGQNLSDAAFRLSNLTDADFHDAKLTNADFGQANLTGADFRNSNLANANFVISYSCQDACYPNLGSDVSATLTDANLTAADGRGAIGLDFALINYPDATTTNLIWPDGHIDGLDLDADGLLVVRGYRNSSGNPASFPITVDQHLSMGPGGALRMSFETDAWDSTISFAPDIPVALGGTLALSFAADVNVASQVGRTFDLFDWTGVNPIGAFAISSPYAWDLSTLYTTGEVTLTAVPEPASFALAVMTFCVLMRRRANRFASIVGLHNCRLTTIGALTLAVALQQSSSHAAALRTAVLSGQPAPGTPAGATYNSFGAHFLFNTPDDEYRGPVINDAGRVAFRADLAGVGVDSSNNQGIWSEVTGSLSLVARAGNAAPGAPNGVNFARNPALELFEPVINAAGQTAFYGGLTDGSVGLWSEGSGSLALVARDGVQAPGTPSGVNHSFELFRDFRPDQPKLNRAGRTAFSSNLTGNGINNTNDWGVWSERSGSLGLVARSGEPAPGISAGVNYDSFFVQTGFNDAGQTAFFAYLTGSGVDPSNDNGIWSEGSGSLALVARSGTPAPGTPNGVTFRDLYPPVAINNAGRVAFEAWLTGDGVDQTNEVGLWSEGSGTLALVARSGNPAPGTAPGVNFASLSSIIGPALNDAGETAFRGELTGSGVNATNSRGIWIASAEAQTLAVRTGNPAPGTPNGVRFSDLSRPALNSEGQIAFRANLTGSGVGSSNNLGIWATDEAGGIQLIARTGSQLEVAPGVFRTVSDMGFVTDTGNSDGRASGFNNVGQLVFWARFTNGTQGIFVSSAVAHLPGDFNNDGTVDATDYVVWRKNDATQIGYDSWRANFGRTLFAGSGAALSFGQLEPAPEQNGFRVPAATVPEPANNLLVATAVCVWMLRRRARPGNTVHSSKDIVETRGGTLMRSLIYLNDRNVVPSIRFARFISIAVILASGAAFSQLTVTTARGATIGFDEYANSPAVIPFDPDASVESLSGYLSGRISTDVKGPLIGGTNINTLLGADTFYSHGYTGTNAVIANIEDGHIWNGHETLTHVQQIPNNPLALNEFDRHATWVGSVLGGRQGGANPGAYQEGMAPDAQLYSGALATQWTGPRRTGNWNSSDSIKFDQFRKAFSTGVNAAGRTADVINSSWGSSAGANGSDTIAIGTDGFVNANPRTLFVSIAHNFGPGPDTVTSPGSAYNSMCVAALGRNPPYDQPAWFSSGGPNDYVDPVNGTKDNVRQVVDIAAPGENLSAAYYGGETGGNGTTDNPLVSGPGPTGLPRGSLGGPDFYSRGGLNGTSLAAPTVAGGAALLYDAAYSVFAPNGDARDARVMKAVLMNSADKTIGWNNGQVAHPNGNGGVLTTQGLDNRVGAGRLNLTTAYDQFLTGTTDIAGIISGDLGLVDDIGWDYGQVVSGTTNDYYFNSPLDGGSVLTATLTWFRDRRINASNTIFDDSFDDLNLELWSVVDGTPTSLISESRSLYNESEHFSFALPVTGDYALRVRWYNEVFDQVADANQELYGLAWWAGAGLQTAAVPEPTTLVLLMFVAAGGCFQRCRGYRKSQQLING